MFCVGAKIEFSDGRQAIARNSGELSKIFEMKAALAGIVCRADSVTLDIRISGDSAAVSVRNADVKEAYALEGAGIDEAKGIALHFMDTGERAPGHNWSKAKWVDRV